jgi:signal peptidase II
MESAEIIKKRKKYNLLTSVTLILIFIGSVGLDQSSKMQAERELMHSTHETNLKIYRGKQVPIGVLGQMQSPTGEPHPYVYLGLNYVRNQGAAWGALSEVSDKVRIPFFYAVTVIAIFVIGLYFKNTPYHHKTARFALILVLSGAFGNLIDRVRLGYVIDWIDVRWDLLGWAYRFPNFNLADSAITMGMILLIIDALILETMRRSRKASSKEEGPLSGPALPNSENKIEV